MIAVETVIRKLVSDLEFIIIPGFGALLSHQVPVNYDMDSGIFAPPVKKLAFNEFLKLDDGLLANFISREENISHLEAVTYIKAYTDVLRSSLQSFGQAKIDGIGEFRANGEGKLIFEPDTENYFKDEWYGFKKVKAMAFESKIAASTHVFEETDSNQVEIVELNQDKKLRINWMRWASAAVLTGLMFYVSFFLVTSNRENNKSTLNPFDNFFSSKSSGNVVTKKSLPERPKSVAESKHVKKEVVVTPDSVKITVSPAVNSVKALSLNSSSTIDKKFYLIAGAFKGVRQAKVLLAEMQSKGYKDAVLIPSSKYSKKVKVAVQGFDEEKEAYKASHQLNDVIGEQGWVYKN